jgi:hypothetical protein
MERRGIEGLFGAQDEGDQRDKAKRQVWIEEAKHRMQEGKTLDAVLAPCARRVPVESTPSSC